MDDKTPDGSSEEPAEQPVAASTNLPTRAVRFPQKGQVIPSALNMYTIGDPIGRGSYGHAFACVDDWGNNLVAKVLLPTGTYEDVRNRFYRELQGLFTLRHPNVTFIYDAFEHEDTFYLVIERCSGNLADLFAIPKFNGYVWFMPVARCVLQAIEFLHLHNVVHRDLHVRNVLCSFVRNEMEYGTTPDFTKRSITFKVADLGISRLETAGDFATGTFAPWMIPPEVLDPATFGEPGRRVDVYHAALLLVAVVSGRELSFTTEEILDGAPRRAAEALGGLCGRPLARALRRHVAERTGTALALWKDLIACGCLSEMGPKGPVPDPDAKETPSPRSSTSRPRSPNNPPLQSLLAEPVPPVWSRTIGNVALFCRIHQHDKPVRSCTCFVVNSRSRRSTSSSVAGVIASGAGPRSTSTRIRSSSPRNAASWPAARASSAASRIRRSASEAWSVTSACLQFFETEKARFHRHLPRPAMTTDTVAGRAI